MIRITTFAFLWLLVASTASAQTHHYISVDVDPTRAIVSGWDEITMVPEDRSEPISLLLARDLIVKDVTSPTGLSWRLDGSPKADHFYSDADSDDAEFVGRAQAIILEPKEKRWPEELTFKIDYAGVIYDSLQAPSKAYSKGFATTTGLIDTAGVFLSGSSLWIPMLPGDLFTFDLEVRMPTGWETVSQGERTVLAANPRWTAVQWHCPHPMEECYLVAARFHVETRTFGDVEAMTYLRGPDPELSESYLSATGRYLSMYENLIGPYPFAKFALVENFWQTGYGMPSFTLLGSQVIRFPWIVHTAYGHEVLHNWWGNGVFIDLEKGNWCEGLTVYGADYLYKEKSGDADARQYRLETLANYMNYVREQDEIALSEFHERHSASTQAIGYGKAMMVYHMLRKKLGDDLFWKSLQAFYRDNLFQEASWDDVRSAFETTSGEDLDDFFDVWIERRGAPELSIHRAVLKQKDDGYRLEAEIRQEKPTYDLEVPVRLASASRETTWTVDVSGKKTRVRVDAPSWLFAPQSQSLKVEFFKDRTETLHVDARVHIPRFAVDPDFDVFRLIDRTEVPATLGEMLGADTTLIVLPEDGDRGYQAFGDQWAARGGASVIDVATLPEELPSPGAMMFFEMVDGIPGVAATETHWEIQGKTIEKKDRTLVFTIRDDEDPDVNYTWVDTEDTSVLPALVRKLPHYGKYSYLVFPNDGGRASEKGIWRVETSPMIVELTAKD
jgi:hypothetical protein